MLDEVGAAARFNEPNGVAVGPNGLVYVADTNNNSIRQITPSGQVSTLAGTSKAGDTDGLGATARFRHPTGIAVAADGALYVADRDNRTIRKITPQGLVTTVAGLAGEEGVVDGKGSAARFQEPTGIAVGPAGMLYVVGGASVIRKISSVTSTVTTLVPLAGTEQASQAIGQGESTHRNFKGVAVAKDGIIYVADEGNEVIQCITPTGKLRLLAGTVQTKGFADGTGTQAQFDSPVGLALASAGTLYIADEYNQVIRAITPAGLVHTVAGASEKKGSADGMGTMARFCLPRGVAVGRDGMVYVADTFNHCIRQITPAGVVSTLAGLAPLVVVPAPPLPALAGSEAPVYTMVGMMPVLPGEEADRTIGNSHHTIAEAVRQRVVVPPGTPTGVVYVQFIVRPSGEITDALVRKGLTPASDAAVLDAIRQLPRLVPGVQNGRIVAVQLDLGIKITRR